MFLQKDLPDKKSLKKLSRDIAEMDAGGVVFAMQFIRAASDMLLSIEKFFTAKGLSHGRYTVLTVLSNAAEGLFPYEIADGLGVSRATASGLIKGLASGGYINVSPSASDGRMKKAVLTEDGRKLFDEITPEYYQLLSKYTSNLDKKTLKQFSGVISTLEETLKSEE